MMLIDEVKAFGGRRALRSTRRRLHATRGSIPYARELEALVMHELKDSNHNTKQLLVNNKSNNQNGYNNSTRNGNKLQHTNKNKKDNRHRSNHTYHISNSIKSLNSKA